MNNNLLRLDVYKMGHMEQYCLGCTKVYAYLMCRNGDRLSDKIVFFGLQYYLKEYLSKPITMEMAEEFLKYRKRILGGENSQDIQDKIRSLAKLGYWPLSIKAVNEGSVVPVKNVLMTITNTLPEFYWCVGFIESLILKVWYPITVATHSWKYKQLVKKYFKETCDGTPTDFTVHDFGYRGDTSEEGAGISGAAHLINFVGSDTVPAYPFLVEYYGASSFDGPPVMLSVPASEHSVMCSFGREDEFKAFEHMLDLYPEGFVSIVSDTFDVYKVLTDFVGRLKDKILARNGKVVFRPDSGDPEKIICGDEDALGGSNERKGAIFLLDEMFGHTINKQGFRELNPKVGLIYGDGMYYERYERTLARLKNMGYAASNLVIGVGGILRNHSRDTLGMAIKATSVIVNGEEREIEKDPVTDHGKKSHKGLLKLEFKDGVYKTLDQVSREEEQQGELKEVFRNGKLTKEIGLEYIRSLLKLQETI